VTSTERETTEDHRSFTTDTTEDHDGLTDRIRKHFYNQSYDSTFTIRQIAIALSMDHKIYDMNGKISNKKEYDSLVARLNELVDNYDTIEKSGRGIYSRIDEGDHPSQRSFSSLSGKKNSKGKLLRSYRRSLRSSSKNKNLTIPQSDITELSVTRTDIAMSMELIKADSRIKHDTVDFLEPPYYTHKVVIKLSTDIGDWTDAIPGTNSAIVYGEGDKVRCAYKRPGLAARELTYVFGAIRSRIKTLYQYGILTEHPKDIEIKFQSFQVRNIHDIEGPREMIEKLEELNYVDMEVVEKHLWLILYRDENGINKEAEVWNMDHPMETLLNSMLTASRFIETELHHKNVNHRLTNIGNELIGKVNKVGQVAIEKFELLDNVSNGLATAALDMRLETSKQSNQISEMKHAVYDAAETSNHFFDQYSITMDRQTDILDKISDIELDTNIRTKNLEKDIESIEKMQIISGSLNLLQFYQRSYEENSIPNRSENLRSFRSSKEIRELNRSANKSTKSLIDEQNWLVDFVGSRSEFKNTVTEFISFIKLRPGLNNTEIRKKLGKNNQFVVNLLSYLENRRFIENRGKEGRSGYAWYYVPKSERENVPQGTDEK